MFPDRFSTHRLMLRPIERQDATAIFESYAQDPDVTRFLTWRPHRSLAETNAYIERCLAVPPDSSRTYVLVGDTAIRGALDLRQTGPGRIEFGYVLARTSWGRGLMTEALTEVVRWALSQPAIVRIGADCDADNIASARVMEKAGLVREGVLHRWLISPNIGEEPRDALIYSRVRPPVAASATRP